MKVNKTGETFSKDSTKKSKRHRRRISRTGQWDMRKEGWQSSRGSSKRTICGVIGARVAPSNQI